MYRNKSIASPFPRSLKISLARHPYQKVARPPSVPLYVCYVADGITCCASLFLKGVMLIAGSLIQRNSSSVVSLHRVPAARISANRLSNAYNYSMNRDTHTSSFGPHSNLITVHYGHKKNAPRAHGFSNWTQAPAT